MKENNEYEVMAPGLNHEHIKGKKNSTHATVVPKLRSRGTKENRGESLAGVVDAFVFDWKTFAHQIKKHHKENQKRLVQCSPQKAPYLALQYCTRTETLPFLPKLFHISSKLQNSQTRRAVSRDR